MGRLKASLRNAFAVDDPARPFEPSEAQRAVVDRICREVVRRHLTTPALLFLEMSRPLNYVSAQTMHFFQPLVAILLDTTSYNHFAEFLEHRGCIDHLCRRIEHFEAGCERRERGQKIGTTDERG